jgi:ABC-type transport system involved in cytochrome bd biosynthesis fused ATPase/permease subunit
LDSFTEAADDETVEFIADDARMDPNEIGFRDAVFSWSNNTSDGSLTPSRRQYSLRIEDELFFKRERINLVVGPTGSGKTSLLMALLGEMHFIPSSLHSCFNLPRRNGVAYAAQESWVQNETIKVISYCVRFLDNTQT